MRTRQPLPNVWLMTDERLGDALWATLGRLPRGSGVVFRHYRTPPKERRALFDRVRRIARARRLVLLVAGPPAQARAWRADGAHGPSPHRTSAMIRAMAVHDARQLHAANRMGADLVFVSPVFPTRSHPGARVLGRLGLARLARQSQVPVVALGGIGVQRALSLRQLQITRWAAIDGLTSPCHPALRRRLPRRSG